MPIICQCQGGIRTSSQNKCVGELPTFPFNFRIGLHFGRTTVSTVRYDAVETNSRTREVFYASRGGQGVALHEPLHLPPAHEYPLLG
jgi:hypothetical protein